MKRLKVSEEMTKEKAEKGISQNLSVSVTKGFLDSLKKSTLGIKGFKIVEFKHDPYSPSRTGFVIVDHNNSKTHALRVGTTVEGGGGKIVCELSWSVAYSNSGSSYQSGVTYVMSEGSGKLSKYTGKAFDEGKELGNMYISELEGSR